MANVPNVEVKGYKGKPNLYSHDLGFVGIVAEFLARLLGVVIPSSSFVERRVRDEYVLLVEQPHEVGEIVDKKTPFREIRSFF